MPIAPSDLRRIASINTPIKIPINKQSVIPNLDIYKANNPTYNRIDKPSEITAAPEPSKLRSIVEKVLSFLPDKVEGFVRGAGQQISEGLFGNQAYRSTGTTLDQDFVSRLSNEGLFPFLGRPEGEKVEILRRSLVKDGVENERASKIATLSVLKRQIPIKDREKRDNVNKQIADLKLNLSEKTDILIADIGQSVGSTLDVTNVLPIGSISGKLTRTTAEAIAKSKVSGEIFGLLKKELPELSDEIATGLSKILVNVNKLDDVEKVLNRTEFALRGVKQPSTGLAKIKPADITPQSIRAYAESKQATIGVSQATPAVAKTSIQKAKASGQSFDDWVKGEGTKTGVEVRDKTGIKLQDPYTAEYLPVNNDGTITVYHSTTKEAAEKIKQSGLTGSRTEGGDIYFTTNKKGYGGIGKDKDTILAFNVDPKKIKFDDVYRGELHLKGNNIDIGGIKPTEVKTRSQLKAEWDKIKTKDVVEESNLFLERNAGKKIDGVTIPKDFKAYRRTVTGDTVDIKKLKSDKEYFVKAYESTFARGYGTDEKLYKILTKELVPTGKEPSGYLSELYRKSKTGETKNNDIKIRQMKTSAEIPSLEKAAEQSTSSAKRPTEKILSEPQEIQKVSYTEDTIQETKVNKEAEKIVGNKDFTNSVKDIAVQPKEPELITTRKFKQTDEWKDFAKYAEENLQNKDISPAVLFRHQTMTMERVAEFLDGGIGGRTYREIVKPVYDSAAKMTTEGSAIKQEVESFRVLEGSTIDRDASLFAQKKIADADPKSKAIAEYIRNQYDDLIVRLNKTRVKIGVEPFPKRKDYITHLNELNVLSELFGGMERISVKKHISNLKSELLDLHPDWSPTRAFDAAKRKVEGLTGVAQYVDARQPIFKFAKQRLGEYEADPSIIRSFNAYMSNALRYIYQAENVARNKAFKDVLPANAKEFTRLWNTEQVAGRQAPSILSPVARRALSAVRGTLGANTILGNLATTMMQLTSWPQVVSLAGPVNTFYGLGSRLRSYIPGLHNMYEGSMTKILRDIDIDIGLGDSLIDKMLIKIGKIDTLRDPAARTRQVVDFGRDLVMAIMKSADQFTVGGSYMAFYRKGVMDGLEPSKAMEFADIMVGKTQANYFKEALPPFLNTIEGKTFGQFGTYGMNQFEMFKRDFGKDFKLDEKNPKSMARFFKQFLVYLVSAYMIDWASEETFGRQPYNVKSLIDDSVGFAKGELTGGQLLNSAKDTVASYVPYMSSVKFGSMPPVFEFGSDVINATLGTGQSQSDAVANLAEKWSYNVLLPYGGNQARKSLQGIEASTKIDLPFVRNVSKNIDIKTNIDAAKSILFGPYASSDAIDYFKNQDKRDGIKQKFEITGTITSDENIEKLKKMTQDEFDIYTKSYTETTLKTILKKTGRKTDLTSTTKSKSLSDIFGSTDKSVPSPFADRNTTDRIKGIFQ
jgi:hypothetical protein